MHEIEKAAIVETGTLSASLDSRCSLNRFNSNEWPKTTFFHVCKVDSMTWQCRGGNRGLCGDMAAREEISLVHQVVIRCSVVDAAT